MCACVCVCVEGGGSSVKDQSQARVCDFLSLSIPSYSTPCVPVPLLVLEHV